MSESFVDLSYRGLALGKRIKLTQVRPTAGYLELPTPMPVGTTIGIATDDGVLLEALVAEVHEQATGSEQPPGMLVKPKLEADAARTWWKQHVSLSDDKVAPQADADGKVTVHSRRTSGPTNVTDLHDDGRNTAVMSTVDDRLPERPSDPGITDPSLPRISQEITAQNPIIDDGNRTMMMDAVDLAALGLDPASSSGSFSSAEVNSADSISGPAITDEDSGGTGNGNGDKVDGKAKKKKKRR